MTVPPPAGPERYSPRLTLFLLGFVLLLYVPFTGNYGLWDPWETHYGEVARQMVERNDWISLWWPGSPDDRATFWSKPVLTFWLMALSMKVFGLGDPHAGAAHAAEMTKGWTAEWALRLPFVLLGIAGVWAVWHLTRRLAGRRAGLWAALVLATSTQWALISRQAMTDMAFVTPMTVALAFAGLALLLPAEEVQADLPRRGVTLLGRRLDWPHARVFYVFLVIYLLCTAPQLIVYCVQLQSWTFFLGSHSYRTLGFVAMLPWVGLWLISLLWISRVRDRRSIYLWVAYLMGGVATLAKGPAGIGMPVIVLGLFIVVTGRFREFLGRRRERPWFFGRFLPGPLRALGDYDGGLEVLRGTLIFVCVAVPWYAAMLVRHGTPFWVEFFGDNYVNRAQGRHGDRGTYEYYLRQLAVGMFPWSGAACAALLRCATWLRRYTGSTRQQLVLLCLMWAVGDFMVVALVNTKFHHYILPALPALAILLGLLLDELSDAAAGLSESLQRASAVALWLVGLPITWLAGRDLANFPARIGWLFNYDYVVSPGSGRPWPVESTYGQRYEYTAQVMVFAVLCTVATALLCWAAGQKAVPGPVPAPGPIPEPDEAPRPPRPAAPLLFFFLFVALLVLGILSAPGAETVAQWASSKLPAQTVLPRWLRLGWLVPAGAAALWLLLLFLFLFKGHRQEWARWRRGITWAGMLVVLSGIAWNAWVLDRFLIDLSPHWSQKSVFAAYYRLRKGPGEPVVIFDLYWRGENFYTRNEIYDHRLAPEDKTVFTKEHAPDKLKTYLGSHRGRRIFFVLERHRLQRVRDLLPAEARASLHVVDESNNKLYLAVAQL